MIELNVADKVGEIEVGGLDDLVRNFEKECERCGERLGDDRGIVNLILCDEKEIAEYNLRYREKEGVTDVLTFPYWDEYGDEGVIIVGDIYICVEVARRQAKDVGWDFSDELRKLFVHGLLHLFEYTHKGDDDEAEMEEVAGRVLE